MSYHTQTSNSSYNSLPSTRSVKSTDTVQTNTLTLFNYTEGTTLLQNGEAYTGYYNVTNGNFYTGREVTVRSGNLTPTDTALGNYFKEKLFFNRVPAETVTLPYNLKSLNFQPGEYINQNSINDKLDKLNANYLELFNYSSAQTSDIPENFIGYVGVSAADAFSFGLNTDRFRSNVSLSNADEGLNNVRCIETVSRKLGPKDRTPSAFVSIYSTLSSIHIFNCPNANTNVRYTLNASTSSVDGFNTRLYTNIRDITTNGRDILYVSDIDHNQIYRIYIDPIVNNSRLTGTDVNYLTGGAELNTAGNNILSGASLIEYGLGELYTYNSLSNTIVVLSDNLSYRRKFTCKELRETDVMSFAINTVDKHLYLLLRNFTVLKVPTDFQTEISTIKFDNKFNDIDTPRKIFFSKNNSNIYYVATTYNLYKYYNAGPDVPIGEFNFNSTNITYLTGANAFTEPDGQIWDASILDENNNYDSLFLLTKLTYNRDLGSGDYSGVDKILRCNEPNSRYKLLENELYESFDLNDIRVSGQYFNNLTLNKSFKKIIYNLDIFSSYLQSRFVYAYDDQDDLKSTGRVPLTATPSFNKDENMYVGSNEVVTPQVLNRCISSILQYQEYLLSKLQGQITNKKLSQTSGDIQYITH